MHSKNHFEHLRGLAEEQLIKLGRKVDFSEIQETSHLLHELDVYNTELDIQNEELRRTQHELEESRNLFYQLYNKAPVGYLIIDHDGLIIQANETLCNMFQIEDVSKLYSYPITNFMFQEDVVLFLSRFRAIVKNPDDKEINLRWLCKNKKMTWVNIRGRNIKSRTLNLKTRKENVLLLIVTDISANKELEISLKLSQSSLKKANYSLSRQSVLLEEKVAQRTRDLSIARDEAVKANQAKTEFLANISHELRTPMHGILGFLDMLQENSAQLSKTQIENYLGHIKISADSLMKLINNLIDLSKLAAGKMEMELSPGSLERTAINCIDVLSQQLDISAGQITWDPETTSSISQFDSMRISQVISNLLLNAIQHTSDGTRLELSVLNAELDNPEIQNTGSDEEEKNTKISALKFSIKDFGQGIPDNELQLIFDKFSQSSQTRNGAGGIGLGLAICAEIIKAHKGIIWAENVPGGGSIFSFIIPVNPG